CPSRKFSRASIPRAAPLQLPSAACSGATRNGDGARPIRRHSMPNIAAVLKQEIARVARREARNQIETLRKSYAQQRRSIAELKRNVAALERRVATLGGSIEKAAPIAAA